MRKKIPQIPTEEQAAVEWIELKAQAARIEKRKAELKEIIEPFLKNCPDRSAELAGWKFSLVDAERESFQLKAAKVKIDGRILAPYITKSSFTTIRTDWKGGEEKDAA